MKLNTNWKMGFVPLIIAVVLIPLGKHYYSLANASRNWSPEILFCKQWKTVCDPSYTDPNGGCAPLDICADNLGDQSAVVYKTKEICESQTGLPCDYSVCDYIPERKTAEEVCGGKIKKGWYPTSQKQPNNTNLKSACELHNGTWLDEYNECEKFSSTEGIAIDECKSLGGEYTECTSACRYNPKAESCIGVCVPICKFK